jgi:hypothetical protein
MSLYIGGSCILIKKSMATLESDAFYELLPVINDVANIAKEDHEYYDDEEFSTLMDKVNT